MRAGKLRHLVDIRRKSTSRNTTSGQLEESWTTTEEVYAAIMPLSGREAEQGKAISAEVSTKIVLRYTDITEDDQLLFNGRTYQIHSVINPEERNIELHLMCSEVK